MRPSWFLFSLAVHGAAISAALAFRASGAARDVDVPARIAIEPVTPSAPSAAQEKPVVEVEVEAGEAEEVLVDVDVEPLEVPEQAPPAAPSREPAPRSSEPLPPSQALLRVRPPAPSPAPPTVEPLLEPAPAEPAAAPSPPQDFVEAMAADNPPPRYPERERRLGHEGAVVLSVQVDASGAVAFVRLRTPSPHAAFDREALRAVRSWRFEPARRDGVAVSSEVDVVVEFRLRDG